MLASGKSQLLVLTSMTSVRVLLVEDEVLIRLAAAEMLHDEGFEVIEAEDGTQAVKLIDGRVVSQFEVGQRGLIMHIVSCLYA